MLLTAHHAQLSQKQTELQFQILSSFNHAQMQNHRKNDTDSMLTSKMRLYLLVERFIRCKISKFTNNLINQSEEI